MCRGAIFPGRRPMPGSVCTTAREEAVHGIRISSMCPGEVDTPLLDERPQPLSAEHRAKILKPEDLGALVLALACLPPHVHVPEVVILPLGQFLD